MSMHMFTHKTHTHTHTFARYSNQLDNLYFIGRVVGAGSFGVVRECVEMSSGKRYAVKSIQKKPKRGPCEEGGCSN